jgi:hypothetical protein
VTRLHAAALDEAVQAVAFVTGWHGGWAELTTWHAAAPRVKPLWIDLGSPAVGGRLARLVRAHDERWSSEIRLSLPRKERGWGTVSRVGCLWAVCGKQQEKRLQAFRPAPTIVLREGSSARRTALWLLRKPLPYQWALRGNKRIAYRLRAVQKHGDPDELRIALPGTCLRMDRGRPIPVVMEHLDGELRGFGARELFGRLRDPPEVRWWEQAK